LVGVQIKVEIITPAGATHRITTVKFNFAAGAQFDIYTIHFVKIVFVDFFGTKINKIL
jgi:hypothetical protein